MQRILIFIFVISTILISPLYAEEITVSKAVQLAIKQNPEVQSYKEIWKSFKAKVPVALSIDDPKIGVERQANGMKMYTGEQMFPFPGKVLSEWKMASHEARMYFARYQEKALSITQQVKNVYYDIFLLERSIETLTEIKKILSVIKNTAEAKYIVGFVIQADVIAANIEYLMMNNEVLNMEQEKKVKESQLKFLLNIKKDSPITVTNNLNLPPTINSYVKFEKIASENRPEIIAMREEINAKKYSNLRSKMNYFPDTGLMLKRRVGGGWDTMLSFSIPLYFWKQTYGVSSTKHDLSSSIAALENMKNMTVWEVREAWTMADTSKRTELLYKTKLIPQSYQALKGAMSSYTTGKIDFQSLLMLVRMYKEAKLKAYENYVSYGKALALLEKLTGKELKCLNEK